MTWFSAISRLLQIGSLLLLGPVAARGQSLGHLPMKIYGVEQGMASEVVVAMEQSQDGILWAATDAGLQVFDGQAFVPSKVTLPSPLLQDLFADGDGSLWVASISGLARVDQGQTFMLGAAQGLPAGGVDRVARDAGGHLWVLCGGKLMVEDGPMKFTPCPPLPVPDLVTQLFVHPGCEPILAMAAQRLWRFSPSASRWEEEPLPALAAHESVSGLALDGTGQQWLRSSMRLWRKPMSGAWRIARANIAGGFSLYSRLDRDRLGYVWFNDAKGLWRARGATEEWFAPPALEGRGALVDRDNGIWLRTHRGVARILGQARWRTYGTEEGLSSPTTWQVMKDASDRIWAGTDLGLDLFEGGRWRTILPNRTLWLSLDPEGGIWAAGSPGGTVHHIDAASLKVRTFRVDPLPLSRLVSGLAVDHDGGVWVGDRQGGLARGRPSGAGWIWSPVLIQGRAPQQIQDILGGEDGRMFVAHQDGVSVFHDGAWQNLPGVLKEVPMVLALNAAQDLAVGYINSPAITLHRFSPGPYFEVARLNPFGEDSHVALYALGWEASGWLWASTSTGAARFLPGRPEAIERFTTMEGLASDDCNQGSLTVASGKVWIGTSRGLSVFQGADPQAAPSIRAPVLLSAKSGKNQLAFRSGPIDVPAGLRDLELSFLVPNYQNPGKMTFQAWLKGVDPQWIDLDLGRVRYPGLRPGRYVLHLRGVLDHVNQGAALEVPFRVLPRWWESVPALFTYGFLALLAVVGLVYARQRALIARNQELQAEVERQTRSLHLASRAKSDFLANMSHELRTPLNAILLYNELLQERAQETADSEAVQDLQRVGTSARHLLTLINGLLDLSKIEAGKMQVCLEDVELAPLLADIEGTLLPLAQSQENELTFIQDPALERMTTDHTKLRQILYNLISNACKFTKQGSITVQASRVGGEICFRVTDTGQGMTREQAGRVFEAFVQAEDTTARTHGGTGLGLTITRKLCELLGGRIALESEPGVGTQVTVMLPMAVRQAGS